MRRALMLAVMTGGLVLAGSAEQAEAHRGWGRGYYGGGWGRPYYGGGWGRSYYRPYYGGWHQPYYGYGGGWRRPYYGYGGWGRPYYGSGVYIQGRNFSFGYFR